MNEQKKRPSYVIRAERARSMEQATEPLPSSPSAFSPPTPPPSSPQLEPSEKSESADLNDLTIVVTGQTIVIAGADFVYCEPQQIHRWAVLLGEAKRELITAEGKYHHWRARGVSAYHTANIKMTEWRARSLVEAMPTFAEYRAAIGCCERNVTVLSALVDTLLAQAR